MNNEGCELNCYMIVETLTSTNVPNKRAHFRNASLILGRNEFKDIIMKINAGKTALKYVIKDITLHKNFYKDGKASINLQPQNVQLLLSNCPPHQLLIFIKTLETKLITLKQKGIVSERDRLYADVKPTFEYISPLNEKDVNVLRDKKNKQIVVKDATPKSKRRRKEDRFALSQTPTSTKKTVTPCSLLTPQLTADQKFVLNTVRNGQNVFFTGSAGTGKSFLLKKILGILPPQFTFATASTGIAACHIGGSTLHSFAGMGSGKAAFEQCLELAQRKPVMQQWRKCRHLVIDEISMVNGEFFAKMEKIARIIRENNEPFGGIQLILCGDFLQLPPVARGNDSPKFCFQTSAWRKCNLTNIELAQVQRQSDPEFINILQNIRKGRCTNDITDRLKATVNNEIERNGIKATCLCSHNEDVDYINEMQLNKLQGESRIFDSTDSDSNIQQQINRLCPVTHKLILKEGAQVMLAKNLDVQQGLVNGARGVVKSFDKTEGYPIVQFVNCIEVIIKPVRWSLKSAGSIYLSRRQIPLKLAWAISIHKSQGMTLDCVEMTLSRVFECGQAYVALSRAASLQGLRVLDFQSNCIRANPDVLKFYENLDLAKRMMQRSLELYAGKENRREY